MNIKAGPVTMKHSEDGMQVPPQESPRYTKENVFSKRESDPMMEKKSGSMMRDGLTPRHVWAYSVGHFNNDLCASMWFVYLTYYLIEVVKVDKTVGAASVLSG